MSFYRKYPYFNWKFYTTIYDDLKKANINTEKKAVIHYIKFGNNEARRTHEIIKTSPKINKVPFENFTSIAKQCYFSSGVTSFKKRICDKFKLIDYYDNNLPCLFFGMYNDNDLIKIKNHQGLKIIIWCGSDANSKLSHSKKTISEVKLLHNIIHISKSISTYDMLNQSDIISILVQYSVVDTNLFKPVSKCCLGRKIFIFNGQHKGREHIYGEKYYNEIIRHLPEFNFIFSNELNATWEEMPNIYKQCFIMLRLTSNDGNANSVQECEAMQIPVVHNQSDYGLQWKTVDDIINHIKNHK